MLIKNGLFYTVFYLAIILLSNRAAFADATQEYTVKAAMALNLARFTDWPDSALIANNSVINLCVLGDNVVQDAFLQMDQKKVGHRTLNVIYLSRLRNVDDCQVLYISGLEKNIIIQLLSEIKHKPILTIGEERTVVDYDGMVNLDTLSGKINIQINLDATKQAGLTISARVLKIATLVKSK